MKASGGPYMLQRDQGCIYAWLSYGFCYVGSARLVRAGNRRVTGLTTRWTEHGVGREGHDKLSDKY
eukprot:2233196-Lingulodinium_polyedra.AAC.1